MRIISLAVACCFAMACNNPATTESAAPVKSVADSLLQQVIDGHDVAMPKIMKLQRLQKEAQAEMDSLKTSASANRKRIALLDSTIKSLSYADVAMQEWMEGFRYDSLKDDEQGRIAYLTIQLQSVNKMKEVVLSSIAAADTVLAK